MQKPVEIPNFQFASRLKIQAGLFLAASTVLEKTGKAGFWYTFSFLTKIITTQIWPSGLLKEKWSIESHFSDAKVLFFLRKYQLQWRENKLFKEENNQSTKEVWLKCM